MHALYRKGRGFCPWFRKHSSGSHIVGAIKGPAPPPCKDIRSAKFAHLPHPERCASASRSHRVSSTEQSLCCLFPVLFLTCVCHRSKDVHQVALRSYGLSYSCGGTEQSFICLNISHSEGLVFNTPQHILIQDRSSGPGKYREREGCC